MWQQNDYASKFDTSWEKVAKSITTVGLLLVQWDK